MFKLLNSVQHYAWGSKTALTMLYGIENPDTLPMAELWMGAHPKSSSALIDEHGNRHSLRDWINQDKETILGAAVSRRFGELPFLFKVLCADQPLSIQVHPSKAAAVIGFDRENGQSVPLDAPERNYKDPNHKPELVYALTPFLAMNAFREFDEIIALFAPLESVHPAVSAFRQAPSGDTLARLFSGLLALEGEAKYQALTALNQVADSQEGEPWKTIRLIRQYYPDDSGLFSPLLLNVVELNPGEAMFLFAETPHAYLQGVALEVMANSDNVLRAGLTPKYIDIPELMANVKFSPVAADALLTQPTVTPQGKIFPIPVDDFSFSLHTLSETPLQLNQTSAAILFCIEGEACLMKDGHHLILAPGESAFISAAESPVTVSGKGRLARVYNTL